MVARGYLDEWNHRTQLKNHRVGDLETELDRLIDAYTLRRVINALRVLQAGRTVRDEE